MRPFSITALLLVLLSGVPRPALALSPETIKSVVSVLPVWPGHAQGGAGTPPGRAPEGSGVVVAEDLIATAWHVIEPADRIDVRLWDGRILPARLVGHDTASDIAVLKLAVALPPLDIAPPPGLAAPVCAIGNAFGLGLSVSCGVVSATGVTSAGFNPVEDFIQTDAAANPGSSGGALVDDNGRLVGMVSAIFASGADTNIGVNFAVSSDLLMRVVAALQRDGAVDYLSAGWRLRDADRPGLTVSAAPVIEGLDPGGPAARAGLKVGDRVQRIGTRAIGSPRDAVTALALLDPAQTSVELGLLDGTAERVVVMRLGSDAAAPDPQTPGGCPHPARVCAARQAVFPVSSFDPVGSAVRIGPDLLVTSRHVVGDRSDAVVHTPAGPRDAVVIASDYRGDLALLRADGLPQEALVLAAGDDPGAPGMVFAVGADIGRQEIRVFAPGRLLAPPAGGATFGRLHVSAYMQPGVSGGALVDGAGRLIGIATGGGEGWFEAIPARDLRTLLTGRNSPDAAAVQSLLGTALVACAEDLDTWQPGKSDPASVVTDCAAANNAGQLLEAGRVLAQSGAYAEGAALHALAVAQVPNSLNARRSLLVSLQLGGRFDDMLPHARKAMDLAPDDPQVLRFAIQSGVWGGDRALAEAGYAALLAADPRQAQAARRFIDAPPPVPPRR